eukprot:8994105-Alexandrium_andersonii.AAC.1
MCIRDSARIKKLTAERQRLAELHDATEAKLAKVKEDLQKASEDLVQARVEYTEIQALLDRKVAEQSPPAQLAKEE